jgi:Protein of unknown function (DUF3027)
MPDVATRVKPDVALVAAVEVARAAAVEEAGADAVGEHLGTVTDGERLVTHRFVSLAPGYRGWTWAVTVSRVSRGKVVTVDEVVQLPGEGALLAPPWVPWVERLQPGDLGPGDLLPTEPDDPRLVPGYVIQPDDEPEVLDVVVELGLGRARVLSPEGRDDAADRWINGRGGPHAELAEAAPAACETCGFLVHLGGGLGRVFGVCSNEWSPSDGLVVSMDHGCGAHSEGAAASIQSRTFVEVSTPVVDETGYDDLGHS